MIDLKWISKVESIIKLCAQAKMPVQVEKDTEPTGIDGQMNLGDIPMEKTGDVYDVELEVNLVFSTSRNDWKVLLSRISLLTQKLSNDQLHIIDGWTRIEDESKLIYSGNIIIKGILNPDILV